MAKRSPEDIYRLLIGALLMGEKRPFPIINGIGLSSYESIHIFTEVDKHVAGRVAEQFRIFEVKLEDRFVGPIIPVGAPGDRIRIDPQIPGTFGCLVEDIHRQPYILTCDHVAGTLVGASPGDAVYDANGLVGHFERGTTVALSATTPNTVDAAIVKPTASNLNNTIPQIGSPNGSAVAQVGHKAKKYGAQTQLTTGEVSYILSAQIIPYRKGKALFVDQLALERDVTGPFAELGDSGSAVLDEQNCVVGLLYAAAPQSNLGFANRIHAVLSALHVSIL